MSEENMSRSPSALARCVHEVVDHIDAEGWDQPPKLYALVPTEMLAAAEPGLLDQLAEGAEYTPIEQESLPEDIIGGSRALDEFLATTHWPESVQGCILVQEIVVLPPEAESDLDHATAPVLTDQHAADEVARLTADAHPDRREARLFVGVLRDGPSLSLLQMRPDEDADPYGDLELPHLRRSCTSPRARPVRDARRGRRRLTESSAARQLSAAGCVATRVEAFE